eukprot:contig_31802_g7750
MTVERLLLTHLSSGRSAVAPDWRGALSRLPVHLCRMYVHAVQSVLFNAMASARLALGEGGPGVVAALEGDLVLVSEDEASAKPGDGGGGDPTPAAGAPQATAAAAVSDELRASAAVRTVTAAEAAAGTIPLTRVVLPLPGTDITYPANAVGAVAVDALAAAGVDLAAAPAGYALAGAYRRLVGMPGEVEWAVRRYRRGDSSPLIVPALDALQGRGGSGGGK